MNTVLCRLCGDDMFKASEKGSFLKRVNEKGVEGIWECHPSCDIKTGNQDDALIRAVKYDR